MADCHSLFLKFEDKITINKSREDSLKASRDGLRTKIRKYFKENKPNEIQPKFSGQGSFMMKTLINPIPTVVEVDGEEKTLHKYDIDDGIYFISDGENERKSIDTYHRWIVDATDGYTTTPPIDKNTCVRIVFSGGHNVDLPIYFSEEDNYQLAHKSEGWIDSDPKEFTKWVKDSYKTNYQIRRLIKYLKAWKDYRESSNSSLNLTSGLVLTILVVNNYENDGRDDLAFLKTLNAIKSTLDLSFVCYRPTTPTDEDLLANYKHKDTFLNELSNLISKCEEAVDEDDKVEACKIWQGVFGDRFSCSSASNESENLNALKAVAATSKPWSK